MYSVFDSRIASLAMIFQLALLMTAVADDPARGNDSEPATTVDQGSETARAVDQWSKTGWPLLQEFCLDCHNADYQEAEIDLSGYKDLSRSEVVSGGAMQRVLEMVRFGAMPPEDSAQPSPEQRKTLVDSLDQTLFAVSCDLRPRPGKVTARRLNKAEYNHSIRDLFGMDLRPADAFPSDDVGAGFDNNGDVLSLSPMLIEKYMTAAEEVSQQVVIDPETLPSIDTSRPSDQLLLHGESKTGSFYGRFLAPDAFVWADFEIPVAGRYRVRIRGGNAVEDAGKALAAVYDREGTLVALEELDYFGGGGSSRSFDFHLELKAGKQRFYVEPLEDEQAKQARKAWKIGETKSERFANLDEATEQAARKRLSDGLKPDRGINEQDFPFVMRKIDVEGPSETPSHLLPPSQKQIVRRVAKRRRGRWHDVEEAAIECLQPLMRRAFREPVSKAEVKPYAALVSQATDRGESYYRGLQIGVSAVLMSPRFLFRVETPPEDQPVEEDGSVRLTSHQLATRLSYFLWSSLPDDELLKAADSGELLNPEKLEKQVRRMIADPRSQSLSEQFAAQWLGLRNLETHEADTGRFPGFTPSLRKAMVRETTMLFNHCLQNNLPTRELLLSDYTFVNEELATHYGIGDVSGDAFQKVSLQGTPRRGVLAHASVLTLTSNPTRTSPVKRGKWILENVLGTPPPEPPAGVPELEETKTAAADASLREQLELHRESPTCASCHRVMDQLGFGLEQFNAIGRFRQREGDHPINASGELPGNRAFNGAAELTKILGETETDAFARTVARRLMTFALGRELTPTDRCTIDAIVERTAENDHRLIDLILEVVNSRPFQYYDWTATTPEREATES